MSQEVSSNNIQTNKRTFALNFQRCVQEIAYAKVEAGTFAEMLAHVCCYEALELVPGEEMAYFKALLDDREPEDRDVRKMLEEFFEFRLDFLYSNLAEDENAYDPYLEDARHIERILTRVMDPDDAEAAAAIDGFFGLFTNTVERGYYRHY